MHSLSITTSVPLIMSLYIRCKWLGRQWEMKSLTQPTVLFKCLRETSGCQFFVPRLASRVVSVRRELGKPE